jgi:hypothetical protein
MEKNKTAEAVDFGSLAVCTQFEHRSMTLRIRLAAELPLSDENRSKWECICAKSIADFKFDASGLIDLFPGASQRLQDNPSGRMVHSSVPWVCSSSKQALESSFCLCNNTLSYRVASFLICKGALYDPPYTNNQQYSHPEHAKPGQALPPAR